MTYVEKSVDVVAPASICYRIASDFAGYPKIMSHIAEIRPTEVENIWHWVLEGPFNHELEFDVHVDQMTPDKAIAFHTIHGDARISYSGLLTFDETSPRRTRVGVKLEYHAPGGKVGEFFVNLLEHPASMIEENLYRFKIMAELQAGETEAPSYHPGGVRRDKI